MYRIYKSAGSRLEELKEIEDGCWVDAVNPTEDEVAYIAERLDIDREFITVALDSEERPRIDKDNDNGTVLIVLDIPYHIEMGNEITKLHETIPLGIITSRKSIVTVCLRESRLIELFAKNSVKSHNTQMRSRFVFQLAYKNAWIYLQYLYQIDKQSTALESEIRRNMRNRELMQLLDLQKSLVYFSTSLKSNEVVLNRLFHSSYISKYEEDAEILEDAIVENAQAVQMAAIYTDILRGTIDILASIISNNMNGVMKMLTSLTIIISVPTLIASFFGMNVPVPMEGISWAFEVLLLLSAILCVAIGVVMYKRKMF